MVDVRYTIELDTQRDGTFSHGLDDISNDVMAMNSFAGMWNWNDRLSSGATSNFTLLNSSGKFHQDDPTAEYYGLLAPGTLVRIRMWVDGVPGVISSLKLLDAPPNVGMFNKYPVITISASDRTEEFQADYTPPIFTDVRGDKALKEVFEKNPFSWPYMESYFFIDVDEIDGPTAIYDPRVIESDPALSDSFSLIPTIADAGSNGLDGTPVRVGLDGSAALFNSGTSYIDLYSAAFNTFFDADNGTLITRQAVAAGAWEDGVVRDVITLKADANNLIVLRKDSTNNTFRWRYKAGGTEEVITNSSYSPAEAFSSGITWDTAASEFKAFLDGQQEGSTLSIGGVWSGALASTGTVIGANSNTPTAVWHGPVTDVVFANTTATVANMETLHIKLDAGNLLTTDLDTYFGAGNWLWYKLDEQYASDGLGHVAADGVGAGLLRNGKTFSTVAGKRYNEATDGTILAEQLDLVDVDKDTLVYKADLTIAASTQGGFGIAWDSIDLPRNGLHVYFDRADNRVKVDKVLAGVFSSNELSEAAAYSAGATLEVDLRDISHVYHLAVTYNGAEMGRVTFTDAEITDNTLHGLHSLRDGGYAENEDVTAISGLLYDFERAYSTLPFVGDITNPNETVTVQLYIDDIITGEIFGYFFFQPRTGKWVSYNRYHDSFETSQYTINDKQISHVTTSKNEHLINDINVQYFPREVGAAGTQLFSSSSVPFALGAGTTREFQIRYRDVNNPSASVGALVVDALVVGSDIIGNSKQDGSGEDWSRFVYASIVGGPGGSTVRLYARKIGDPVWITTFNVNGTPLKTYNPEIAKAVNGQSVHDNGRHSVKETFMTMTDADEAQVVADYMVNSLGTPQVWFKRIVVPITDDSALMVQALTIGDAITVTDDLTGHSLDYIVVGEAHNPQINDVDSVAYTLKPQLFTHVFVIDSSAIDGTDVMGI